MENLPIRVLLVDPSPLWLQKLEHMLADAPEICVVGRARNGSEALVCAAALRPAVICLAAQLPGLGALEVTRQLMSQHPCAILALGGAPGDDRTLKSLLEAGAVDVWCKPPAWDDQAPAGGELAGKIKRLSRVPLISRPRRRQALGLVTANGVTANGVTANGATANSAVTNRATANGGQKSAARVRPLDWFSGKSGEEPKVVALGSSTGGPQALLEILSLLPRDYPWPVLCVQHISSGFGADLIGWLASQCSIPIKVARDGEKACPGQVYFAPDDQHLELRSGQTLCLAGDDRCDGHQPSVTRLFESVARHAGGRSVAALLSGMGSDGARGLHTLRKAGALTMAQNEDSCVVFGMPRRAIELGAVQLVLPPREIARRLLSLSAARTGV